MADQGKPKETNRLKARLPRGLMDRGSAEIAATRRMLETIRKVYELYGFEPVETPGRFRQFMQFDADTVGSASPAADAEICMMAADTMEALGTPRGSYVVKVNNRKVLDGLIAMMGIDPESAAHANERMTVLRALDKIDRLRWNGVEQLLGPGRKDDSGYFTPGAGLADKAIYTFKACIDGGLPVDCPFVDDPSRPMNDMKRCSLRNRGLRGSA